MRNQIRGARAPLLFALFLFATASAGLRGQQKPKITGTYTSMEFVPDAGDVVGEELHIVGTAPVYQGSFQLADGEPGPLVIVSVRITDSKISFDLPPGLGLVPPAKFEGTIQNGLIRGRNFSKGQVVGDKVLMKRGKSYWD